MLNLLSITTSFTPRKRNEWARMSLKIVTVTGGFTSHMLRNILSTKSNAMLLFAIFGG